jgi:hypothetical protein
VENGGSDAVAPLTQEEGNVRAVNDLKTVVAAGGTRKNPIPVSPIPPERRKRRSPSQQRLRWKNLRRSRTRLSILLKRFSAETPPRPASLKLTARALLARNARIRNVVDAGGVADVEVTLKTAAVVAVLKTVAVVANGATESPAERPETGQMVIAVASADGAGGGAAAAATAATLAVATTAAAMAAAAAIVAATTTPPDAAMNRMA